MNWEIRPFGELYATPSRNGLMRPSKERGSGYKMINMGELFAYPIIKNPDMERVQVSDIELPKYRIEKGDLLFARQSLVLEGAGKCSIVAEIEDSTVYESHLIRVRLNKELCDPFFYFHFFNSQVGAGFVQQIVNQVAAAGIRGSDLEKLKVIYPPLPVQQKIAAILSAYDDLIENNNKRIALLEKAAEEIYREWFVRMRFPGWEQVKFVKGIPERWEYKSMRELIEFHIGGGWGEENVSIDFSEGAYVIRGTDLPSINSGDFPKEVFRYHKASNYKSRKLHSGDIIFEVAGGSKDQWLGRTAIMTNNILAYYGDRVICASFCKLIRFDKNKISPYFMKYFLNLYYSTGLVSTYQVQSTGISNYQFEGFLSGQKVLVPSEDLKKAFDKQIIPLVEQKDKLSLANILLKETRDLLLSRLISGKLSVEALDIRFPPSMSS